MNRAWLVSLVVLCPLWLACPAKKCDASTCASGCCDSTGTCRTGDSAAACGTAGGACTACVSGVCSALKVCMSTGSGGGGGSGGGTGGGTGGGVTGGGTGSDGGVRTVTFVRHVARTQEDGTTLVDDTLPSGTIALLVRDGGAYVEVPGVRSSNAYVVNGVAAGSYVMHYGTVWLESSVDQLDVGFNDLGRATPTLLDAGAASVTINVSGLPAWADGDDVEFFSVGANLYGVGSVAFTTPPTPGQVPTSLSLDWGSVAFFDQAPAVDSTKGDSLYLSYLQSTALITTPVPGAADDGGVLDVPLVCQVAKSSLKMSTITLTPGTNTLSASFVNAPMLSLGITWPRTQWDALRTLVHPQAVTTGESLYYVAEPAPETASGDLLNCFNDARFDNPISDVNRSLMVGNPYPSTWGVAGSLSVGFRMSKSVADAGTWSSTGTGTVKVDVGQPLVPAVRPPRAGTVQSITFESVITVATASPLVVNWMPPTAGPTPTRYRVSLLQLTKDAQGIITRSTVAMGITSGTSVLFPVGVVQLGGVYQLRIESQLTAAPDSKPFASRYTSTFTTISNPFLAQ